MLEVSKEGHENKCKEEEMPETGRKKIQLDVFLRSKFIKIVNCGTLCKTAPCWGVWCSRTEGFQRNGTISTRQNPRHKFVIIDQAPLMRRFQRSFHRLGKAQVWTAYFVSIKFIIWSRTQSDKPLSLSLLDNFLLALRLLLVK